MTHLKINHVKFQLYIIEYIVVFWLNVSLVNKKIIFVVSSRVSHPQDRGPWHQLYRAAKFRLEFVILFFYAVFLNKCFIVEIFWGEKYSWMCRKAQTQMLAWGNYNMLQDFISPVIDI